MILAEDIVTLRDYEPFDQISAEVEETSPLRADDNNHDCHRGEERLLKST